MWVKDGGTNDASGPRVQPGAVRASPSQYKILKPRTCGLKPRAGACSRIGPGDTDAQTIEAALYQLHGRQRWRVILLKSQQPEDVAQTQRSESSDVGA